MLTLHSAYYIFMKDNNKNDILLGLKLMNTDRYFQQVTEIPYSFTTFIWYFFAQNYFNTA